MGDEDATSDNYSEDVYEDFEPCSEDAASNDEDSQQVAGPQADTEGAHVAFAGMGAPQEAEDRPETEAEERYSEDEHPRSEGSGGARTDDAYSMAFTSMPSGLQEDKTETEAEERYSEDEHPRSERSGGARTDDAYSMAFTSMPSGLQEDKTETEAEERYSDDEYEEEDRQDIEAEERYSDDEYEEEDRQDIEAEERYSEAEERYSDDEYEDRQDIEAEERYSEEEQPRSEDSGARTDKEDRTDDAHSVAFASMASGLQDETEDRSATEAQETIGEEEQPRSEDSGARTDKEDRTDDAHSEEEQPRSEDSGARTDKEDRTDDAHSVAFASMASGLQDETEDRSATEAQETIGEEEQPRSEDSGARTEKEDRADDAHSEAERLPRLEDDASSKGDQKAQRPEDSVGGEEKVDQVHSEADPTPDAEREGQDQCEALETGSDSEAAGVDDGPQVEEDESERLQKELHLTPAEKRARFEGRDQSVVALQKKKKVRTPAREAAKLLSSLRQLGGGSIGVAWRRLFDVDEAKFPEFCCALVTLHFSGDVIRLWHDLAGPSTPVLKLEAVDPESASLLQAFKAWCTSRLGGPVEVFRAIDLASDGSGSVKTEKFVEGLQKLGFFQPKGAAWQMKTPELVLQKLWPLLDHHCRGCITTDSLLFLEKDPQKRAAVHRERNRRPKRSPEGHKSDKIIHNLLLETTAMGNKHWSQIPDGHVAVGRPLSGLKEPKEPKEPKSMSRASSAPMLQAEASFRQALPKSASDTAQADAEDLPLLDLKTRPKVTHARRAYCSSLVNLPVLWAPPESTEVTSLKRPKKVFSFDPTRIQSFLSTPGEDVWRHYLQYFGEGTSDEGAHEPCK
ncbi:unnamed protein product [Effrenium voratum]|nr:unnamed protein product [Effrenium voratum]